MLILAIPCSTSNSPPNGARIAIMLVIGAYTKISTCMLCLCNRNNTPVVIYACYTGILTATAVYTTRQAE